MGRDSRWRGRGRTSSGASRSTSSSRPSSPLIGVTYSLDRRRDGEVIDEPEAYVAALERHGARGEPLENDPSRLPEYLERIDGLILSGGLDVDPARYGGTPVESVDHSNAARDEFEIALVREARARRIPLLGICRGLQVANVAFGGTLFEHIAGHREVTHEVSLEPGALRTLLGVDSTATNSLHHQAVRATAGDLIVAGRAPDGTIEALEGGFDHPFFFAVQWHPELLPADDAVAKRLFAGLVSAARRPLDRA